MIRQKHHSGFSMPLSYSVSAAYGTDAVDFEILIHISEKKPAEDMKKSEFFRFPLFLCPLSRYNAGST